MQANVDKKQIDLFLDKCKQNNLKVTPQRTAIFRALIQSENHPSADDIFQIVRQEFPNISFDTVNRTMLTFTQIGIISIAESYKGARRFDPNIESHHHLHCIHCGRIIDFTNEEFDHLKIPEKIRRKSRKD